MKNSFASLYNKNKNLFEEMLLNNLANPILLLEQDNIGQTVLHNLVDNNDSKCVENVLTFVKNNLSSSDKQRFLDTQDKNGNTAFHVAIRKKLFQIATMLDKYGASKKIPNNDNEIIESTDESEMQNDNKCTNDNKLEGLIKNIIKPQHNYESDSDMPSSLDGLILTDINLNNMLKRNKQVEPLDKLSEAFDSVFFTISTNKNYDKFSNFQMPDRLTDFDMPNKLTEYDMPDRLTDIDDDNERTNGKSGIMDYFKNFFGYGASKKKQYGGSKVESDNNSTSEFLQMIDKKISQNGGNDPLDNINSLSEIQHGGKKARKSKKSKSRKVKRELSSTGSKDINKAEEIHHEVIKMIQDLGYSEEEAKVYKAGLYAYTKEKHPELNNYNRALKMKSYATQQYIANIDMNAVRQAMKKHFTEKKKHTPKKE